MNPGTRRSVRAQHGDLSLILVVDNDAVARAWLRRQLERAGYAVEEACSPGGALEYLHRSSPDVVLLNCEPPDCGGVDFLRKLRDRSASPTVIMVTGDPSLELAVEAMSQGAEYVLPKPIAVDRLLRRLELALSAHARRSETRWGSELEPGADPLVARSVPMIEAKALLEKVARASAATVLLTGESGVGKDAAARFLHRESARADGEFVNITCSALPDNLLESELFGHERGAFTDAKQRKTGLLEQADGGTVFLDEIGEMAPRLQAKLLRFLEERAFRRVGGSTDIRPDVWVIAATHRDLPAAVRAGTFRQDLYYRLAVLHVHIPPLRERPEDVEALARHFNRRFGAIFNKPAKGISAGALARLRAHRWPGNVRELKNAIERAVLMIESDEIGDDLVLEAAGAPPEDITDRPVFDLPKEGLRLDEVEQELVIQALERTDGNKTRAAMLLGLTRDQIRSRIEKYGL